MTINVVESLLNAANRAHEVSAFYVRKSDGVTRSVRVTRESGDLAPYTADDTPQTYRVVVFSTDADALGGMPQRGDMLYLGTETFRVVEQEGVTWQRRFETYGGRIFFYTEKVNGITVPVPSGDDGPYVPPDVYSGVFDEVTITQQGDGRWGVDPNYMEGFLQRTVEVAIVRADTKYLPAALLPYQEWDAATDYETGDLVYRDGRVYQATAPHHGRDPRDSSVGAGAVWKALVFDTAAFAAVSGTIQTTPSSGDPQPGTGTLIPTTAAVVDYVAAVLADRTSGDERTIIGDGITRVFPLTDAVPMRPSEELGANNRPCGFALYNAAGRRCYCAYTCDGEGNVTLVFSEPPAAGEIFKVILKI